MKAEITVSDRPPAAVGSVWHTKAGVNVWVTDVIDRRGAFVVKLVTEDGRQRECGLHDLGTLFQYGYV